MQRIPKSVGLVLPDRYYTSLRYWTNAQVNLSATRIQGGRYIPTNAFDVDPAFGSTAMPGFSELAAIYGQYRVLRSKFKVQVANPSTTIPMQIIVVPLNYDPGASPSAPTVVGWKGNPRAVSRTTALAGGPIATLVNEMSTEKINGSKAVYFDDSFASLVSTGPVNNWFWALGFSASAVIAATVYYDVTVDVGIEFFARRPLIT
jgi:hypothetical protein